MISAGQTKVTDITVGRRILCVEKADVTRKAKCEKKLKATLTAAKKGLTSKQQKLWQRYVYTPALLQARRFCYPIFGNNGAEGARTKPQLYTDCVLEILSGKKSIEGLFKTKFKWSDYLIDGAKIIKKMPTLPPSAWEQ